MGKVKLSLSFKILSLVILLNLYFLSNYANASNLKAFVVEKRGTDIILINDGTLQYVIGHNYDCYDSEFIKGEVIYIDTYFSPSYGDAIIIPGYINTVCEVTDSERVNIKKYYVDHILDSEDKIIVSNNSGTYLIEYGIRCSLSMWKYEGKSIDIDIGGTFLDGIGDRIYLFDSGRNCRVWDAEEISNNNFNNYNSLENVCPPYSYRSNKDYMEIQENENGCVCNYGYEWNKNNTACVKDTCKEQHAVNFGKNVLNWDGCLINLNGACCICREGYKMYNNQKCIRKEEYDKIFKNRPDGTLIKTEEGLGIYQIEGGRKRPIKSAKIFLAKGYKWGDVVEISQAEMNSYPLGTDLTIIDENNENKEIPSEQKPAGTLSNGSLVRAKGSYGVYLIHNNQKRPIKSATIFLGRGYKWGNVVDVEQSVLNAYPLGESVTLSESITTKNEAEIITINVPRLRVRSLPSLDGKIITLVSNGQEYSAIDERNGWYKIYYNPSKTGWVMSKYTIKN